MWILGGRGLIGGSDWGWFNYADFLMVVLLEMFVADMGLRY